MLWVAVKLALDSRTMYESATGTLVPLGSRYVRLLHSRLAGAGDRVPLGTRAPLLITDVTDVQEF
jgi:hypothetical protein